MTTSKREQASIPSVRENLSLFAMPPSEAGIEKRYFVNHRPVSQLTDASSPYEFSFGGKSMDMLDMKNSTLHVKVQLTDADGKDIAEKDQVGPCNLLLHSLWEKVDIRYQGQLMTHTLGDYAYSAYMKTLKCLGAGNNNLESVGFVLDSGHMDSSGKIDIEADGKKSSQVNIGAMTRKDWLEGGKTFQMEGPLLADVCEADRYLLNQTEVGITLYRTRPQFHIAAQDNTTQYKINIQDIYFRACYVKPSPGVLLGINKALEADHRALYPYTKTEVRSFTIPKGFLDVTWDNVFQGVVPDQVVVGMVSDAAKSGSYTKNPYNFQHYDVRELGLSVDGVYVPTQPIKLDFSEGGQNFVAAYRDFMSCMISCPDDVAINMNSYRNGYTLFVFNLDNDKIPSTGEGDFNLVKRGSARLELRFGTALPETVSLIVYSAYKTVFQVDKTRKVFNN